MLNQDVADNQAFSTTGFQSGRTSSTSRTSFTGSPIVVNDNGRRSAIDATSPRRLSPNAQVSPSAIIAVDAPEYYTVQPVSANCNTSTIESIVLKNSTERLPAYTPARRSSTSEFDAMRFAVPNSQPRLTPLGHRLLTLSERKLADLDASLGGRDESAALWKGVVMREAVRSAWRSVEDGTSGNFTDWRHQSAQALDVIGEDEEEDASTADDGSWFDDVISTLGDDGAFNGVAGDLDWIESSVSGPAADDFVDEFDVESIEAYTIPLPRSPSPPPATLPVEVTTVTVGPAGEYYEGEYVYEHATTTVEICEVDDGDNESIASFDSDATVATVRPLSTSAPRSHTWHARPPIAPVIAPASPPYIEYADGAYCDSDGDCWDPDADIDDGPDYCLPPPLVRSMSESSSSDHSECSTPAMQASICEDLEVDSATLGKDARGKVIDLDSLGERLRSHGLGLSGLDGEPEANLSSSSFFSDE